MNTTKLKRLLAAGLPISLLMMASGTHALCAVSSSRTSQAV